MAGLCRRKGLLRPGGVFRQKGPFQPERQNPVLRAGLLAAVSLIAVLLLPAAGGDPGERRFFLEPTLLLPVDTMHQYLVLQEDSIPNDTLFQLRSAEGFPLAYYRKINTNVCFDGKCRMLKVRLYWNITGRYLGIELPPEEFLSKSDHERFNLAEYARMNRLLADSLSPLGDYTFEELVPAADELIPSGMSQDVGGFKVDAVTSATAPGMKEYVVEGAAYTTFRLWHFVYGPTQDEVIRLTEKSLSPALLQKILESPDMSDVAWAFQRIRAYPELNSELRKTIAGFIKNEDYSLASMAIASINPTDMASASMQHALFEKLPELNYSLKNKIIEKFREAPTLDKDVKTGLVERLATADGSFMTNILELFIDQEITDDETLRNVSDLLEHKNNFIAGKVFKFLETAGSKDEIVLQRMTRYKQQQQH